MTRRKRKEKRKKSSESDELDSKCPRREGGSSGGHSLSQTVSEIIKEARQTLYSGSDGEDDGRDISGLNVSDLFISTVFEHAGTSISEMAESQHKEGESMTLSTDQRNQASLNDIMTLLNAINNKIQRIDTRLEKLEKLESKVEKLDTDIKAQISKLWNHVQDTTKKLDDRIRKVEDSVESNSFASGLIDEKVTVLENKCKQAKEDMLYIQSQSMRNNLVFSSIPEEKDETPEISERILRKFLTDKLQMAQDIVDGIRFEHVHRMGPRRHDGKTRSIVAKFNYFKDREEVRRQSSKLKNTGFFINEQFPRDVADRRKKLYPKMMAERKAGRKAWLSYDALYVDGKRVDVGGD